MDKIVEREWVPGVRVRLDLSGFDALREYDAQNDFERAVVEQAETQAFAEPVEDGWA